MMLLNRELVSRVKLCLVSVFTDIVKDCPKMRNLSKIFLRSFENVGRCTRVNCDQKTFQSRLKNFTRCVCVCISGVFCCRHRESSAYRDERTGNKERYKKG